MHCAAVAGYWVKWHPDAQDLVSLERQIREVLMPWRRLGRAGLLGEDLIVEEVKAAQPRNDLAGHISHRPVQCPRLEGIVEQPRPGLPEEPGLTLVGVVLRRWVGPRHEAVHTIPQEIHPVDRDDSAENRAAVGLIGRPFFLGYRPDQSSSRIAEVSIQRGDGHHSTS